MNLNESTIWARAQTAVAALLWVAGQVPTQQDADPELPYGGGQR